jgi:hypothetical protein
MLMGQVLKDEGRINLSHRIEIENDHGRAVDRVWFRDVVQVEGVNDGRKNATHATE